MSLFEFDKSGIIGIIEDMEDVFTLAQERDLNEILAIYDEAREFMARNGNPTQWGTGGYPEPELLMYDISLNRLFVLKREGRIEAVFVLAFGDEPTYAEIENGAWPNDEPYATIHRLASRTDAHGCGRAAIGYCKEKTGEKGVGLRADTHENNAPMLHLLKTSGFVYCGTIRVRGGAKRLAFQLVQ